MSQLLIDLLLTFGVSTTLAFVIFKAAKTIGPRNTLSLRIFTCVAWAVAVFAYGAFVLGPLQVQGILSGAKWLPAAYFGSTVLYFGLYERWYHNKVDHGGE